MKLICPVDLVDDIQHIRNLVGVVQPTEGNAQLELANMRPQSGTDVTQAVLVVRLPDDVCSHARSPLSEHHERQAGFWILKQVRTDIGDNR